MASRADKSTRTRPKLPPGVRIERSGRPTNLRRIIDHNPDGTPVTSADRALQLIGMGEPLAIAAAAAGMSTDSISQHLRHGALINNQLERGRRTELALTPTEKAELDFHRAFGDAYARGVAFHAGLRSQIMRGGTQITTRTTTTRTIPNPDEKKPPIVETTEVTKTETLGPDPVMLRWFAERRWPEAFGTEVLVRHTVDPLELPTEDRIAAMVAAAEEFLGDASPIIEATTVDE